MARSGRERDPAVCANARAGGARRRARAESRGPTAPAPPGRPLAGRLRVCNHARFNVQEGGEAVVFSTKEVVMHRFICSRHIVAAVVSAAAVVGSPGCGSQGAAPAQPAALGRIALPLTSAANGHDYRLRNVFVSIYGPQYAQLFDGNDGAQSALSATLSTGDYTAYLNGGWVLQRDDGAGGVLPVTANLVSSYAVGFTIFNGATSTVSYVFQTDGVIVTVGSGQVRVTATIDEVDASCVPFGASCGEGSWCPPTTLTGMARACVAAGVTPVGSPCATPTECVANASCFDLDRPFSSPTIAIPSPVSRASGWRRSPRWGMPACLILVETPERARPAVDPRAARIDVFSRFGWHRVRHGGGRVARLHGRPAGAPAAGP